MNKYYGFRNNQKSIILLKDFRKSYTLKSEQNLKDFLKNINEVYDNYSILWGFKREFKNNMVKSYENPKILPYRTIQCHLKKDYEKFYRGINDD